MKPQNTVLADLLDLDAPEATQDVLWTVGSPHSVRVVDGHIGIELEFFAQVLCEEGITPDKNIPSKRHTLWVSAYSEEIIRLTINFNSNELPAVDNNVMLDINEKIERLPLSVNRFSSKNSQGWNIIDATGKKRMEINTQSPLIKQWSDLIPAPPETFNATIYPDGSTPVLLEPYDIFKPEQHESFPLAYIERKNLPHRATFAFHASANEKIAGTGERFAPMNLSGRTLVLENADALGVNNRRCYKNVPFYVSSRPYGLLILTSAHTRLSLSDISTRVNQAMIEDGLVDLFVIGGKNIERILYNYRLLTGFPHEVPVWSYGVWMGRMTYFTADETRQVADRLRQESFPCDVIHVDTGWFDKDWICDWKFSPRTFPDPQNYLEEMRSNGFRVTLWQLPSVSAETELYAPALENKFIASNNNIVSNFSNFGDRGLAATIDFTNPQAIEWYQGLLEKLLQIGVAAFKTDFGETIDLQATYEGMDAKLLHNVYSLLYQKAAFEITEKVTGKGLIWARSGWVGNQRYPVHWGGDTACTWDGMAGSLRGGLHLGLSGYAFWGHDIGGFHGLPNFMNSWPTDELYMRWTQFGVFSSHFRYHGTSPREPYEYPAIADLVRQWWNLRYALIPYLVEQGQQITNNGLPMLQALIFHHQDDPMCWHIDDQYYFGNAFLVAPIMNDEGIRDVYLPAGKWIDFWTGEVLEGNCWLKEIKMPLEFMPIYAKFGSQVPVYPHRVQCTDEMDLTKAEKVIFDDQYDGFQNSILGLIVSL
ncbi:MAG: alpha-xylosidase [Anaerolineales bacterium]|nr:alpha-xylosidase [Anaerolineales bacterium]